MKRKEKPICPYCKKENATKKAIGTSGLINYSGMNKSIECLNCGKNFHCEVEVTIRYTTSKHIED